MVRKGDHQRWLLLGAAVTFFIFAPRGLLVGLVVLALLAVRCPQRLLRRARVSFIEPSKNADQATQVAAQSDGDCGATLVLVFEARDPVTNVQQLKIKAAQDISSWTLEDPDESPEASPSLRPDELLRRLKDAGLSYRLGSSAAGEFVFCLVRLPEQTAQANLAFYPIDLQLDADHAQRYASDLGMLLGLRSESCDFQEIDTCESYDSRTGEAQSPLGTLEDVWADLHMRFCPQIPRRVFQHYPLVSGLDKGNDQLSSILPPSQRLRMLLSLVGDDLPGAVGTMGPGLKLDQWKKPKFYNCLLHTCRNFGANRVARVAAGHTQREFPRAFSLYFLMQDPRDATFQRLRMKFGRPGSALFRHGLLSGVVDRTGSTARNDDHSGTSQVSQGVTRCHKVSRMVTHCKSF